MGMLPVFCCKKGMLYEMEVIIKEKGRNSLDLNPKDVAITSTGVHDLKAAVGRRAKKRS